MGSGQVPGQLLWILCREPYVTSSGFGVLTAAGIVGESVGDDCQT